MKSCMLTVATGMGLRDVRVDGVPTIREAIPLAEKHYGARVSHGQGGVGADFDPAVTINAETGEVIEHHDRNAIESGRFQWAN